MTKKDLSTRADVELLVNSFYDKVRANEILGVIFNDIAKVDWEDHLPKMYSFWSSILLGERSYSGRPMKVHIDLSRKATMNEAAFNEWLTLFHQTVDELFSGATAETAKTRSVHIARNMIYKIQKA